MFRTEILTLEFSMKQSVQLFLVAIVSTVTIALATDCTTQPPKMECRMYLPAWYYNTRTRSCQLRQCHNTLLNRYDTKALCEQTCIRGAESEGDGEMPEDCRLEPAVGPCLARIPRYFYDVSAGRCKRFFFGGCQGNANNFPRRRACRNRCQGVIPDLEDRAGGISTVEIDQN